MNRASAMIFSLLFLWANGAYGFSGPCCCTIETGGSMRYAEDGVTIRGASCDHEGPCNDCGCKSHSSFRCVGEFEPLRSAAFESVRPEPQIFVLPLAVTDVAEFMQNFRSGRGRTRSFHLILIDLFLQTCSFLS